MFSLTLSLCSKYFIRFIFVSISIKSLSHHQKIKFLLYAIKDPFGPTVAEFYTLYLETKLLRRKKASPPMRHLMLVDNKTGIFENL